MSLKRKYVLLIAAVAISTVIAIRTFLASSKPCERDPMLVIVMLYDGGERGVASGLQMARNLSYSQHRFRSPSDTLHVVCGSSVEFAARLGEQPSHHLSTIENAADPANDGIVIEDVRLYNNTFVVDLDTGKYVVSLTGVWVKMTYPVKAWIR